MMIAVNTDWIQSESAEILSAVWFPTVTYIRM